MTLVLTDSKYKNELNILIQDPVVISMAKALTSPDKVDELPMGFVISKYKSFGGTHEPLTLGSISRAIKARAELDQK